MQRLNKKYIFFITVGLILFIIIIAMGTIAFSPSANDTQNQITPSPIQTSPSQLQPSPSPRALYSPGSAQKMIDKVTNRVPVSSSDLAAKEKILTILPSGQISGVLYRSSTVIIDYTNAADQFQVEILTVNIAQAKNEGVAWFKLQGMSQEGICNLPIVFYINRGIADQLRNSSIQFDPLAEGC